MVDTLQHVNELILAIPAACRGCTYDLGAVESDVCPECGDPIPALTKTGIREMTDAETALTQRLASEKSHLIFAAATYLLVLVVAAIVLAGFVTSSAIVNYKLLVGAFALFVVAAPLPYLRGRLLEYKRRSRRAEGDIHRGVIESLEMPVTRAVRIGQPRGAEVTIAGREPPRGPDVTMWFLLLEGDNDAWAILSPHALRLLLNDKPTTCPSRLCIDRSPRAGVVFDVRLEGEPIAVSGAKGHISTQRIISDVEITHRKHIGKLVSVLGAAPWDH